MNDKITELCNQIEAAVNAVYIRGCDDIAMSNLAQLRGIYNAAEQIKTEVSVKEEKQNA